MVSAGYMANTRGCGEGAVTGRSDSVVECWQGVGRDCRDGGRVGRVGLTARR